MEVTAAANSTSWLLSTALAPGAGDTLLPSHYESDRNGKLVRMVPDRE